MDEKPAMTKGQRIAALAIAVICGTILAWLWYAHPQFGGFKRGGMTLIDWLVVILILILLIDLPTCFMILIGHPPVMTLSPLIPSAEERACWKRLRERPLLDDDAFYERFYAGTGIPKEVPIRLRRRYAKGLLMDKVWPEDKAAEFDWEVDFADVLGMAENEFGVKFTEADIGVIDRSFDSIVRVVAKKLRQR